MNKYTEIIEKYLSGQMSATEKIDFEKQVETNSELKSELQAQQQILKGIERAGIKSEINKGFKKGSFKNKAGKWMLGIAITALAVGTVMVVKKTNVEQPTFFKAESAVSVKQQEENLRYELTEENNQNWGDADKQLKSQFFVVNGKRDTVIETESGIILAIPAKSFYKSNGEEVVEGIEVEVKAALTPMDIMKAGLSTLSNGELLRTGGMFYVNARNGGENLTIKGKGIYASIPTNERDKDMMLFDGERKPDGQINWVKPKRFENRLNTVNILNLDFYPANFLDSLQMMGYNTKDKKMTDSIYYSFVCGSKTETEDRVMGQAVPIKDRVETRSISGISAAISITQSESGNHTRSKDILQTYTNCEIAPSRIRAIWDKKFNKTLLATREFEERLQAIFKTCNPEVLNLYINNMNKKMYQVDSMASKLLNEGKNESSAVFKKFYLRRDGGVSINESHLKELQKYMEEKRSVYESVAVKTLKELYTKEQIQDEMAWQEQNEYDVKERDRVNKLFYEEVQTNLESAYGQLGKAYKRPPSSNSLVNYHYEALYWAAPAPYYYSAPILTTGWKNVDAYAYESVAKRQTLDYTDPVSGKKAVIKYTPLIVHIEGSDKYDRVVAYLIPDKLSTFQRMPYKDNVYKENLNELIHYSAVVFGFKGKDVYFNSIKEVKAGSQTLALNAMSKKELMEYSFLNSGATTDLISELNHQLFEQKETLRKKIKSKRDDVRRRLMPVVFPCAVSQPAPQPPLYEE